MKVVLRIGVMCACLVPAFAAPPQGTDNFGPYNSAFLEGGVGESRPLTANSGLLAASAPWSMTGWLRLTAPLSGTVVIAGVGKSDADECRCLILQEGRLGLRLGDKPLLSSEQTRDLTQWHAVAATYDGTTARLYIDGMESVAQASVTSRATPVINLAPEGAHHFGGSLADFTLHSSALSASAVASLSQSKPDFALITFNPIGVGWPWQVRSWRGLLEPQDPWTLPHARTPPSAPVASAVPQTPQSLTPADRNTWTLGAWKLIETSKVNADDAEISSVGFQDATWYPAVVPGTVLTTLIARGLYPDPYYGLNNLAIPETLARQDYWYRTTFDAPTDLYERELTLIFKGINYQADVWVNGKRAGMIKGAFVRGVFDVTDLIEPGRQNAIAVRISPPPHPGIPHEESIVAGPGENGGNLAIDGPTFVASEGWDWIPGIRDRNTGIWQPVQLHSSGKVHFLDPHVVTDLPLPRTDEASVSISAPVVNLNPSPTQVTVAARFEGVRVTKTLEVPPGESEIRLDPAEFPQLLVRNPRLWWPNGYGSPELYTLSLTVNDGHEESDSRSLRFGMRKLTYELSLFDSSGRLRRVEVDPTAGSARSEQLIDVRHEAIKKTPTGWAESLTSAGESSPAVHEVPTASLSPYLVIRVNGVPIAARGGSWGTDDALKRVSRERLEPYFKLHRDAHLNIIRNWLGQNTEDVFYDLADEYGLLVLNDFWESTQDFQLEVQDPQLFLENARDVVSRYRNHPSIAVWFGRNEGVPQPILNEGLDSIIAQLDGTRYYTGSSNRVNLAGSGPYNYRPPAQYFTSLASGFSVEVGTPSLSTLESIEASVPEADRWPISDTLAYHDWHFGGNGDIASFMAALTTQFGKPTSLADFERKAQMMNLVTYRAIFEGFQAHLWTRNSGRLLWMTHPAWPSNMWQIYSSDYDTAGAYYAVKAACEPLHAQMNLADFALAVVNTTREARHGMKLRSRVLSLDNRVLVSRTDDVDVAADSVATLPPLELANYFSQNEVVLVALSLMDSRGKVVSDSLYWQGRDEGSLRRLNDLPPQPITVTAQETRGASEATVTVDLVNRGTAPAFAAKLTAVDEQGKRTLPVYYGDNYITLLPGASKKVEIRCPTNGARCARIELRGWNVQPITAVVTAR
jgi:beta-galactosidase/beta-glucuronidase